MKAPKPTAAQELLTIIDAQEPFDAGSFPFFSACAYGLEKHFQAASAGTRETTQAWLLEMLDRVTRPEAV